MDKFDIWAESTWFFDGAVLIGVVLLAIYFVCRKLYDRGWNEGFKQAITNDTIFLEILMDRNWDDHKKVVALIDHYRKEG